MHKLVSKLIHRSLSRRWRVWSLMWSAGITSSRWS